MTVLRESLPRIEKDGFGLVGDWDPSPYAVGVNGTLERDLIDLRCLYKSSDLWFGQVNNRHGLQVQYAFSPDAATTFRMSRYRNGQAQLAGWSLNMAALLITLQGLVSTSGFSPVKPCDESVENFVGWIDDLDAKYKEINGRADTLGVTPKDMFRAENFRLFLRKGYGMSKEEAREAAWKRFEIPNGKV